MPRPNVLFLMSDEHPVFMTGCYGHRSVKTPTIDALAARGVVFDAAYTPSPICCPARAAMMTGRHTHVIEVWDNASPLRSDWPTFAHSFRAAGYRTALCGKMHFVGPDQHHGFEERWTQDIYPATFDWTRSNRAGTAVNPGQNIDRIYEAGPGRTTDMAYDEEIAFRTLTGLRRFKKESPDKPFMLCVSFTGPHYPFKAPPEYWNRYSDADVDLPKIPSDYLSREHEHVKWLRTHGRFDHLVPDHVCLAARRSILARITMVDDYLRSILQCAESEGLLENTIVVYASDHGDMMGEHGLWFKNSAYEWSSRVPLIVTGPGIAARRSSEAVSLLDLGPTLCGLAGIDPVYDRTDGRNLTDLIRGQRADGPGQAIMENYAEGVWRGWRMIRRGNFKLNFVPGCEPELYDLSQDPDEWNNLAAQAQYKDVRDELTRRVMEGWNPAVCDEKRWQSEERRLAILRTLGPGQPAAWQITSPSVPHPLQFGKGSIDNTKT
jgi:choline-sulfatase